MRLPNFEFCEPSTIEEALSMVGNGKNARLLAGGTDLIPRMKFRMEQPAVLISLKGVEGLRGVKAKRREIHIGAMTLLADLFYSPIVKEVLPALHQAVEAVAAPPIWNCATLGGNIFQNSRCLFYNQSKAWRLEQPPCAKAGGTICHAVPKGKKCFSVYSGDLAPALIALGAEAIIEGKEGAKRSLLWSLFTGNGLSPFTLKPGEILTGVVIPKPARGNGSSYVKLRMRPSVDYPLVSAAATVTVGKNGKIRQTGLVVGAAGPRPVFAEADRFFAGKTIDEVDLDGVGKILQKETMMVDNLALSGAYRRRMVPVVVKRAFRAAIEAAGVSQR
jgi:4-hydroxybenzoyl-CoA reductase beta subunit